MFINVIDTSVQGAARLKPVLMEVAEESAFSYMLHLSLRLFPIFR